MEEKFIYAVHGMKWNCYLKLRKYPNGRNCLVLIDEDGIPVTVITVNVPESPLLEDEIFVKNYSENTDMDIWLVENGLASHTGLFVRSGYASIPVMKLTKKAKSILNV